MHHSALFNDRYVKDVLIVVVFFDRIVSCDSKFGGNVEPRIFVVSGLHATSISTKIELSSASRLSVVRIVGRSDIPRLDIVFRGVVYPGVQVRIPEHQIVRRWAVSVQLSEVAGGELLEDACCVADD